MFTVDIALYPYIVLYDLYPCYISRSLYFYLNISVHKICHRTVRLSDKVAGSNLTRGAVLCPSLSLLLSTGSTQENIPR